MRQHYGMPIVGFFGSVVQIGLEFLIDGVRICFTQVLAWRPAQNVRRDTILRSGAALPVAMQDTTWRRKLRKTERSRNLAASQ